VKKVSHLKELREKQDVELRFDIAQRDRELFDLRFKSSSEGLANPSRIAALRRDIARMKTLLRERELRGAGTRT
jgi:large subunit ribosomal protein L29